LKRLKHLEKRDRVERLLALVELADTFGQPHSHGGIGIRKLGDRLFECRGNLARLAFPFRKSIRRSLCFLPGRPRGGPETAAQRQPSLRSRYRVRAATRANSLANCAARSAVSFSCAARRLKSLRVAAISRMS